MIRLENSIEGIIIPQRHLCQVPIFLSFKKTHIVMKRNVYIIKLSQGFNTVSCTLAEIPVAKRKLLSAQLKKQLSYISPLLSLPGDTQDICFLSSFKHVLRSQESLRGKSKNGFQTTWKNGINTML